jgi:hypothetical protein
MFIEKYVGSLTSNDLRDDELHRATEALAAAALADLSGGGGAVFGSMLARAKYADGISHKTFEAGNHNIAVLLRVWTQVVANKGFDRCWMKIKHEWDIKAAYAMYAKIAWVSLAHWLGGECDQCHGTKVCEGRACTHCHGTGKEPIQGGALEREYVADMVSELEGLFLSHGARAGAKMRKVA